MTATNPIIELITPPKSWLWGIISACIILIGLSIPQLLYLGRMGETYNMLNHFISELGEVGISEGAAIFNICLIIGGLCNLPFLWGIKSKFPSRMGVIASWLGVISGITAALVGVFPMNDLTSHSIVASTFFIASAVTMGILGLLIRQQERPMIPTKLAWGCFTSPIFALAMFITLSGDFSTFITLVNRPALWFATIFEWLTVLNILFVFIVLSYFGYKTANP